MSELPYRTRLQILRRDRHTCTYCGRRYAEASYFDDRPLWCGGPHWISLLEVNHIVPHCQGGSDDLDNLTTACRSCNREKAGRTPEAWRNG